MKLLRLRGLSRPLEAFRDRHGVPHIRAANWPDALYGLGFLQATDRRTQLQFARTLAQGRAAELLFDRPKIREHDRVLKWLGLTGDLEREAAALDPDVRNDLEHFCQGINDGLRQAGRSLTMWALGYRPEPWDLSAVLILGNYLHLVALAMGQYRGERIVLDLLRSGVDPARMQALFHPQLDELDVSLLRQVKAPNRLTDEALAAITWLPKLAGSNAWAIAPQRSRTGFALLASDPHLEIHRLPCVWYEAVLEWGDQALLGATLPGTPFFSVGRTRELAWGVTYSMADACDHFFEDCRIQEGKVQYRRGERWADFRVREDRVGGAQRGPETLRIYENDLGTLEGNPQTEGAGIYFLLAGMRPQPGQGKALETWLRLPQCRTVRSAQDLVRESPAPNLCWVLADRAGHIGRQVSGHFPRRPNPQRGLLPLPAWDERNHWQGTLPQISLPSEYDPPAGFVCSANEDLNRPGAPLLTSLPAPDYRWKRIHDQLSACEMWDVAACWKLQHDVGSVQGQELLRALLADVPPGPVRETLAAWDFHYRPASLGAGVFARFYHFLLREIFGRPVAAGGLGDRRLRYLMTQRGFGLTMTRALDRALLDAKSPFWADRDRSQVLLSVLDRLSAERSKTWGQLNRLRFTNAFWDGPFRKVLGMQHGPVPIPGCQATPFQGQLTKAGRTVSSFAPSYHFVADLSEPSAWTNLPGGPSEQWFSRWYKNDLRRWIRGEPKILEFTPEKK